MRAGVLALFTISLSRTCQQVSPLCLFSLSAQPETMYHTYVAMPVMSDVLKNCFIKGVLVGNMVGWSGVHGVAEHGVP